MDLILGTWLTWFRQGVNSSNTSSFPVGTGMTAMQVLEWPESHSCWPAVCYILLIEVNNYTLTPNTASRSCAVNFPAAKPDFDCGWESITKTRTIHRLVLKNLDTWRCRIPKTWIRRLLTHNEFLGTEFKYLIACLLILINCNLAF